MSNLLQKASIVTTPTAYGVGVLNSIKPAQSFGSELVTNGNFATDSNWTKSSGATISNGSAHIISDGTYQFIYQVLVLTIGRKYRVEYEIVENNSGSLKMSSSFGLSPIVSTVGVHSFDAVAISSTLYIERQTACNIKITNISVKEITDADFDFTRTSSATRVNPDYLIETVSINSANLVQNGNFSELGTDLITNGTFDTDSNWIKGTGTTISGGNANFVNATGVSLYQNIGTQTGTVKVEFTVTNYTSGTLNVYSGANQSVGVVNVSANALGTYTAYVVRTGGNVNIIFGSSDSFTGSIDNVSVKQVDPNDNWTVINGSITDIYNASMTAYQSGIRITPFSYTGTFKVVFDLVVTSGSCKFDAGSGNDEIYTTSGTKEKIITNPTKFEFNAFNLGWVGTLDNVSVIELQQNGVPRLDYTNGTASILLEPQSTNLLTYSSDFSQWGNARTTDTANQITSPDGLNNGTLLEQQSGQTNAGSIFFSVSLSSGTYTQSIYAKKKDKNYIVAYDANANRTYFNLEEGCIKTVASGVTADMIAMPNGWYRCIITYTITTGAVIAFYLADNDNSTTVTDSGGIYIYGAQLEVGSYSTSLIHTSGSTVTRAAETLNNAGNSDLFNPNEGVLYIETAALANDGTTRQISLSDGSSSPNKVSILYLSTTNEIKAFIRGGGAVSMNLSFTLNNALEFNKIALKYKVDDFALWVNGTEVLTDNSGAIPTGLSDLSFDDADGTQPFYGKCKMVAVFKEALSDTELACLTSTNNREIFLNYYYRMQYVGANTEALSCAEQTFNI